VTVQAQRVQLVDGDISNDFRSVIEKAAVVAWDIETSGLDWQADSIGTCQLHVPSYGSQVVRIGEHPPARLRETLASPHVLKVFHHAPFDLRFMRHHWDVVAQNVACTKILSKLVRPEASGQEHSLKPTLEQFLGVVLDKSQQTSNWLSTSLTEEQIYYAVRDVEYLVPLLAALMKAARASGAADIVKETFDYLPVRVETDIRGCGDVFAY
jgi:ribonuclease D